MQGGLAFGFQLDLASRSPLLGPGLYQYSPPQEAGPGGRLPCDRPPPPRLGRQTRRGPKVFPRPSRRQPTRTASEQPPADCPAAASRRTAAKSTQAAHLVETHKAGLHQHCRPAMQKKQSPPSQSQPTGTASESPPADRPAARSRPTDAKSTRTADLVGTGDGLYQYSFPQNTQCTPSPHQSTRTASEKPLADRPTAASHPVDVKATQTAAFVAMQGPELYQYSRNGYRSAEN